MLAPFTNGNVMMSALWKRSKAVIILVHFANGRSLQFMISTLCVQMLVCARRTLARTAARVFQVWANTSVNAASASWAMTAS